MSTAANADESGTPLEHHRQRIERYICSMIRDSSEAEDLTQETFLRAHARRDSLRDPAAALGWLYRIATRATLDRLRQKVRNEQREYDGDTYVIDLADTRGPTLLKVLEQKEMSACVQSYIGKLANAYRAVILLHDLHGLSAEEISEMLHLPVTTVKIRIHRARQKLHAELGEGCHFLHDEDGNLICEPKATEIDRLRLAGQSCNTQRSLEALNVNVRDVGHICHEEPPQSSSHLFELR